MATKATRRAWLLLALLPLAACDKKAPPNSAPPAIAQKAATAPAQDPYAAVAASLQGVYEALDAILPLEASLTYSISGDPVAVRAALMKAQPDILRLIEVSRLPMNANQDLAALGRLRALSTTLFGDMSRCFDDKDWTGCVERELAVLRLAQRAIEIDAVFGGSHVHLAAQKLHALTDAGLAPHLTAEQRHALDTAIGAFDTDNVEPVIASWLQSAMESINESRATFAVEGGPARLADQLEQVGADTDEIPGMNPDEANLISMAMPLKSKAAAVRSLTPADITQVITRADNLLPMVESAMRSPDILTSMKPVGDALRADETQLLKLIVGCPGASIRVLQQAKGDIDAARAALK